DSGSGGMDPGGLAPVGSAAAVAQGSAPPAKVKQATSAEAEEIRKRLAEQNKNVWDSKWLLIGSTILMLICLAGVALWWSLTRGNEAERFKAAEDDYRAQSYTAAIKKYEDYLKNFPKGTDVSTARVRIGISKLRIAVE